MNAHLVTLNDALLKLMSARVREAGLDVRLSLQRQPGEPLSNALQSVSDGILIAELDPNQIEADLESLQSAALIRRGCTAILMANDPPAWALLKAMRAGVREVLSVPPSLESLVAALNRIKQDRPHHESASSDSVSNGRIVSFVSTKGGSGATFFAANMAHLISTDYKKRCALIDLDLQFGDASFYLCESGTKNNISDLTRQIERLDAQLLNSTMRAINPHLSLLAAPEEPETALSITAAQLESVLTLAQSCFDWVLIDLDRSLDALAIKALDRSDTIFLVMQNTIGGVRDAKRLVQIFRSLGYPDEKMRLILNRHERPVLVDLPRIAEIVGLKVRHTLPNHYSAVSQSINMGKPLADVKPTSPLVKAMRQTAADLLQAPMPERSAWLGRFLRPSI